LPDPIDENWVDFKDITPEWVAEICKKVSEDNDWEANLTAEVEAKKTAPVSMTFEWQKSAPAPVKPTE
jgi:hypothetical protein